MSEEPRFGPGDTIVVVGGSIAGLSASQELRRLGFAGRICVLDADHDAPYRRPEVSKSMLSAAAAPTSVIAWPPELDVERSTGFTAESLDSRSQRVIGSHRGKRVSLAYDGLVIATGCVARTVLPAFATDRVHSLRSMADSSRLRDQLHQARTIAVVGGGFIGLEVAALATSAGKRTTVIEAGSLPLEPQLGEALAADLLSRHVAAGTTFALGDQVVELQPREASVGILTAAGRDMEVDLVVEAVGSSPATDWLETSGVELDRGVVCDIDCAAVGVENVVAAGDVAVWTNPLYGRRMRVEHWTNAIEQGTYVAARLLGMNDPGGFASLPYFWSTQGGIKLQALGSITGHDSATIVRQDEESMLVEYHTGDRLVAVAGIHAGRDVMRSRRALLGMG